jgi:hypothetical protein
MMNRITAEYIENSTGFRKLTELKYDHIIPFVFENIKKTTLSSRFYFFVNSITLFLILYFLIHGLRTDTLSFQEFIKQFVTGLFAGSILVIPFHEGFHGLAFKLAGAPRIHYGADLKQMIFYVTAHNYVIGRYPFYFVALAPFVMINLIVIILYLTTGFFALQTTLTLLFFHNIMCIGDFAMISFYQQNPGKELYTWDDISIKTSYIYEKL